MTTNTNPKNTAAELLATIEARHKALLITQASGFNGGWVIKCGAMCIRIAGANGERTDACGLEMASHYSLRSNADSLAARVTNGAGERGRVVSYQDAVAEELAACNAALTALRQAVAALS